MANSLGFSKNKLILFGLLIICIVLPCSIKFIMDSSFENLGYFLIELLFITISFQLFISRKRLIIFEPITLFSYFYYTVVIAGFYVLTTNFSNTHYITDTQFSNDIIIIFDWAMFYLLVGYIFTIIGYRLIINNKFQMKIDIVFEDKSKVSDSVLNIIIVLFFFIGLINFLYNVYIFANGNVISYFKDVSIRKYQFSTQGTTVGYNFIYTSIYVWFYKFLRNKSKVNYLFVIGMLIALTIKASDGRIFDTLLFVLSFFSVFYFYQFTRIGKTKNKRYFIILVFLAVCGITFYFFRLMSSLLYNNILAEPISAYFDEFINNFGYYSVDKGNIPNIAILMKVIDSWKNDIGYLYGSSLFTWVYDIIPSKIRPVGYQPSALIKGTWYSQVVSGNLPPTGVGEMYANFGPFGPFLGMLIFGVLAGLLFKGLVKFKNYWFLVIYSQIVIGFIMIYPKGEFDNLSVWSILPTVITYLIIRVMSQNT